MIRRRLDYDLLRTASMFAVLSFIPGLCFLFTGQRFSAASRESSLQALLARKKP